jgi:uncharacterized protein (DUF1778 family)
METQINIRLNRDLKQKIEVTAGLLQISMSDFIRMTMADAVRNCAKLVPKQQRQGSPCKTRTQTQP